MKTSITKISLAALAGVFVLSSCRKDQDPLPENPASSPTTVKIELSHLAGGSALSFSSPYNDDFGNVFTITRADFYVNGFLLKDDMGDTVLSSTAHYVVNPALQEISLGSVNGTHVHMLHFNVGVDTLLNLTVDPATQPAGSALGVQTPSMYWGWSSGYRFIVLEGMADRDADSVPESMYQMHIGLNMLYSSVALETHSDLTANAENMLHIEIDYLRFFDGIDMSLSTSHTHTMDNMPLATQVKNNVDSVFSVHSH